MHPDPPVLFVSDSLLRNNSREWQISRRFIAPIVDTESLSRFSSHWKTLLIRPVDVVIVVIFEFQSHVNVNASRYGLHWRGGARR